MTDTETNPFIPTNLEPAEAHGQTSPSDTLRKSMAQELAGEADIMQDQLAELRQALYPPDSRKTMRTFTRDETASFIGVSPSYMKKLLQDPEIRSVDGIEVVGRTTMFNLTAINSVREILDSRSTRTYVPHRNREGMDSAEPLQIVAVSNFKGGSAKTTTSLHLAQYLALHGYRVLCIDLDPQASLTSMFGYAPEFDIPENESVYAALRHDESRRPLSDIILSTYFDGIHLAPASIELAEFEIETATAVRRQVARDRNNAQSLFYDALRKSIEPIEDNYDIVVVDCPPQLGFLTLTAMCSATGILLTVHPQLLDIASMGQFLRMASGLIGVLERRGMYLPTQWRAFLLTRHNPNDRSEVRVSRMLESLFGDVVLRNAALYSTAIGNAGLSHQSLYELSRRDIDGKTYDRARQSMDAAMAEVHDLITQTWGRK